MLALATRNTKACKIERTIHVERTTQVFATITEHKQLKTKTTSTSTVYKLRRLQDTAADFGVCVQVEKLDGSGECYEVSLSEILGSQCTCPAGTYNRGECRHIACCREATKRGLI